MRIGMIGHNDAGKSMLSNVLRHVCGNEVEFIDESAEQINEDFFKSNHFDGLIIVISSTDGPMPYTKKHIELASKFKTQAIGIWINKTDIFWLGSEWLELIEMEVRELLSIYGLEDEKIPAAYGSALKALKDIDKDLIDSDNLAQIRDFWNQLKKYRSEQIVDLK